MACPFENTALAGSQGKNMTGAKKRRPAPKDRTMAIQHLKRSKPESEKAEDDAKVRGVVDHEGWCQSIYFKDPNGLQLEYCCLTREFNDDDAVPQVRFRIDAEGVKHPA